jgi:hypothetical protein
MSNDRIPCCVPFCGRTADRAKQRGATQIICQKHWKMVPAETKARYRHVRRRARKIWRAVYVSTKLQQPGRDALIMRANAECDRVWERIKREAIERAAGL